MALGILSIIYIVFILATILLQILLYRNNDNSKNNNLIFWSNVILGLVLAFISFTSFPSNYIVQKIISAAFGGLAILAIILKMSSEKSQSISKIILTISILGGLLLLFI